MIMEIEKRELELKGHKERLEEEVTKRTAELLALNKDLVRARTQADEANKAKSEFLANMSHEIRTPMNAILGFAELLKKRIFDGEQKRWISSIFSSGKTLLSLINDILDLSKIEAGKMSLEYSAVNPVNIFNEITQIFSNKIESKQLEFITNVSSELNLSLILDETRLRQILFNIVGNAVKFTEKGHIKLSATQQYSDNQKSTLDLIFSVEDTGVGIPDTQQQVIFEAFRQQSGQSQAKFGGTGLGLAITKRLVEIMGGEIHLKSQVNKGSIFSIIIKNIAVSSMDQAIKKQELKQDVTKIVFKPASILYVDDIRPNRVLIRDYLKHYDLEIFEAVNGKDGLEKAATHVPNLILMDMKMPEMDGYTATRLLKNDKSLQHIPVVALTASVMKDDIAEINKIGCDDILEKPVNLEDIINILIKYLPYHVDEPKQDQANETKATTDTVLTVENNENLTLVLQKLENEYYSRWKAAQDAFIFSEIEELGNEIKNFGIEYDIDILKQWGTLTTEQAASYDMESLPAQLGKFEDIINIIKDKSTA